MDANGLRFWMVADGRQWHRTGDPPDLDYDQGRRHLRLARRRASRPVETGPVDQALRRAAAVSLLERVPQTRDSLDTRAYWDPVSGSIRATGALADAVDLWWPEQAPTDLVMGHDDVLHAAIDGAVCLFDCRGRWPTQSVGHGDCEAWRLAPTPGGGVWVLDRKRRNLWRLSGAPLAAVAPSREPEATNRLCSCEPNPDPPRLTLVQANVIPTAETVVGLAASPAGRLAILSWNSSGDGTGLLRLLRKGQVVGPIALQDAPFPWSLVWVSEERLAIRSAAFPEEAPVYALPPEEITTPPGGLKPLGDLYPLRRAQPQPGQPIDRWVPGPFVHGLTLPPHYPQLREQADEPPRTAPLDALPLPTHAREGEALGLGPFEAARPPTPPAEPRLPTVDSGRADTVWHRLYLEAAIPANGGIVVELAASDTPERPTTAEDWHPHHFGERFLSGDGQVPVGTWLAEPSELPFHPGVLQCAPQPRRSGLFTALIQRAGRQVRRLQGRYLWVRARLSGDGCGSPELAALRVYGSRFSYRDHYLPELYQENVYGEDADQRSGRSTPADFLERFLAIGEGVLTPLEDRIAQAHLLTSASTAPAEALEWLGSWLGVSLEPGWSEARRRRWLSRTPELYRRRGTRAGLELALDIASDGGVSSGAILVLEDFRLRRTFATILGADLADEEDPLLGGWAVSGNSVVGDTLILGEQARDEILALFRLPPDALSLSEREAIRDFFERLAHRATVLVHDQVTPQDLGLIRRVVDLETPAHVETQVVTASYPLLVGVASLVGVDTFLAPRPAPAKVRLDHSSLDRAFLQSPASLDPRLERGVQPLLGRARPVSGIRGPQDVEENQSFALDGSPSRAGPGREINRYRWRRVT
jgi:phage tail-like protein